MRVREPVTNIFCDEEIVEDTTNITPNITCKAFGNSTRDDLSRQWREKLLIQANQQVGTPKNVSEWMVGSQTGMDIIKPWYAAHPLACPRFFGSQTDVIRTDTSPTIANNFTEISPEIKELSQSNVLFNDVLTTALSEISFLLDKEMDKLNYQIKVKIEEDLEIPDWKETLISIKIPKRNPKDLIRLWKVVEKRVREKIESIKEENEEEITKINDNLVIVIDELE